MATLAAVMTDPVPPPRRAGALGAALAAVLVHDPAARPTGEQLDRMLAAAEHGTPVPLGPPTPAGPALPLGPPTPAGPAFPAPAGGPGYRQQYPAYRQPDPLSLPYSVPPAARRRTAGIIAAYTVSAVAVIAAVAFLITIMNTHVTPSGNRAGVTTTQLATVPNDDVPGDQSGSTDAGETPDTTAAGQPADLLTPAGARTVVTAMTEVMGGSKVSDLTIYEDNAMATAPAPAVENGFDDFSYRDGTATREGPDTVDADRAVLDLNTVNWDALPALWERANNELGVAKPTLRYVIVDTDIIDGTPSLKLYLNDDYGAAYLIANLAGEVVKLYPRDS
jgi:hypothetical protein